MTPSEQIDTKQSLYDAKNELTMAILTLIDDFKEKHGQIVYHIHLKVNRDGHLLGIEKRYKHKNEKGKYV